MAKLKEREPVMRDDLRNVTDYLGKIRMCLFPDQEPTFEQGVYINTLLVRLAEVGLDILPTEDGTGPGDVDTGLAQPTQQQFEVGRAMVEQAEAEEAVRPRRRRRTHKQIKADVQEARGNRMTADEGIALRKQIKAYRRENKQAGATDIARALEQPVWRIRRYL